jgi:hypothetical protein
MRDETYILLFIPVAVILLSVPACENCGGETPSPDPTSVTTSMSSPAPSSPVPPAPAWAVVETLGSVADRWGAPPEDDGPWAYIRRGKSPYPWYVTFAVSADDPEYNCGVYEQLTDYWRVAYCKGGELEGGRRALRLILHIKPDAPEQLRIRLTGTDVNLILGRQ